MRAQQLREAFLHDVDADTAAFDAMMAARKLQRTLRLRRKRASMLSEQR